MTIDIIFLKKNKHKNKFNKYFKYWKQLIKLLH